MGDVMSLIERAQETFDEEEARVMQKKLRTASFNFEDFLKQVQSLKKMGPLSGIMEMIPGMRGALKGMGGMPDFNDKQFKRVEAMITSMTVRSDATRPSLTAAGASESLRAAAPPYKKSISFSISSKTCRR